MALTLKYNAILSDDSKSLAIYDTTGTYDASSNPGGWGASGEYEKTDISSVDLIVTLTDDTIYTIDITSSFDDMETIPYLLDMGELGGSATSKFADGFYTIQIKIVMSDTAVRSITKWEFLYSALKCCVYKNLAGVDVEKCCCDNPEDQRIIKMLTAYISMKYAAMVGDKIKATKFYDYVNRICSNSTICESC